MPAIYFVNKCDKSTMTDLEIVRITAIYKDKNEIPACFGFECSSASEGVRRKTSTSEKKVSSFVGRSKGAAIHACFILYK